MISASDKCREQSAQYVVVLDGVWYRMDGNMDIAGGLCRLAPQEMPPPEVAGGMTPAKTKHSLTAHVKLVSVVGAPTDAEDFPSTQMKVDDESSARPAKTVKPFNRDGAEPLRAGHPDLWNLLVVGTSLEGTAFCSG